MISDDKSNLKSVYWQCRASGQTVSDSGNLPIARPVKFKSNQFSNFHNLLHVPITDITRKSNPFHVSPRAPFAQHMCPTTTTIDYALSSNVTSILSLSIHLIIDTMISNLTLPQGHQPPPFHRPPIHGRHHPPYPPPLPPLRRHPLRRHPLPLLPPHP